MSLSQRERGNIISIMDFKIRSMYMLYVEKWREKIML